MTSCSSSLRRMVLCVIGLCALLGPSGSRSEVAVGSRDGGAISVYSLNGILDETDPVGSVWQDFSGGSAVGAVLNSAGFENEDGKPTFVMNPVSNLRATWPATFRNKAE